MPHIRSFWRKPRFLWVLVTAPGYILGWSLASIKWGAVWPHSFGNVLGYDLILDLAGILGGIMIGVGQWLILRRWLAGAIGWIPPAIIGTTAVLSSGSTWSVMVLVILWQMLILIFNHRARESTNWGIWSMLTWIGAAMLRGHFTGSYGIWFICGYSIAIGIFTGGSIAELFVQKKLNRNNLLEANIFAGFGRNVRRLKAGINFLKGDFACWRGKRRKGIKRHRFFNEACAFYENGLDIDGQSYKAISDWGYALIELAKVSTGTEAERLINHAFKKFQTSYEMESKQYKMLYRWACALYRQAGQKTGEKAELLYEKAYEKFAEVLELKRDMYKAYYHWGTALLKQAIHKDGEEAVELLEQAAEKLQAALKIKPDLYDAICNWGYTLIEQAKYSPTWQAEELLHKAHEHFETSFKMKPKQYQSHLHLGVVLLRQAALMKDDRLFADAKSKFLKAEHLAPGSAAYNMARLSLLSGQKADCLEWLEKSRRYGFLPTMEDILADPDLRGVQDREWFKDFLSYGGLTSREKYG